MKKFLASVCAILLLVTVSFGLVGCTPEEIQQTTETAVNTATSILPYEYSAELATAILANARTNSMFETGYKAVGNMRTYLSNGEFYTAEEDSFIYNEDKTIVTSYAERKVKRTTGNFEDYYKTYVTVINESYYTLSTFYGAEGEIDSKQASVLNRVEGITDVATTILMCANLTGGGDSMNYISNVIGGRYFNGKSYVSVKTREVTAVTGGDSIVEHTAEYVIEDNKIASVDISIARSGIVLNNLPAFSLIHYDFTYGPQIIENVPTSLTGYTVG